MRIIDTIVGWFKKKPAPDSMVVMSKDQKWDRYGKGRGEIERLKTKGYRIHEFTPYQFRINDVLDIYPMNKKWHDLVNNKRGAYTEVFSFVSAFFHSR